MTQSSGRCSVSSGEPATVAVDNDSTYANSGVQTLHKTDETTLCSCPNAGVCVMYAMVARRLLMLLLCERQRSDGALTVCRSVWSAYCCGSVGERVQCSAVLCCAVFQYGRWLAVLLFRVAVPHVRSRRPIVISCLFSVSVVDFQPFRL